MKPVVMAPLDGSPDAEAALPWAVYLAQKALGELKLVGVHAPPAVLLDGQTVVGSVVPDDTVRGQEETYFSEVQARLRTAGVPVSADLIDGSVITSLAAYAATKRPDWVVMLSHHRGAVARFFLGETALEFVRESPCPVLLIPEGRAPTAPDVREVLVPLDGSPLSETMIGPAVKFASTVGARLSLVNVGTGDRANELEPLARANGAQLIIIEGDAATAIVAAAEARPGSVVALATHARGGLVKLFRGSVADDIVHRIKTPVLLMKGEEPATT
ncbi:MAG TPA: universal stress protein [Gemmataceae bacterium]|nr:universal stress protein [Gemmataceae bacterium]